MRCKDIKFIFALEYFIGIGLCRNELYLFNFWLLLIFCGLFCEAGLASLAVIVGRYASGLEAYISVSILIIVHFDPGPSNRICKLLITVCLVILCIVVFLIL